MILKLNLTKNSEILKNEKNEIILNVIENDYGKFFACNLLTVEGSSLDDFYKNNELSALDICLDKDGNIISNYIKNETINKYNTIISSDYIKNKKAGKRYLLKSSDDLYLDIDIKDNFEFNEFYKPINTKIEKKIYNIQELIEFCDEKQIKIKRNRIINDKILCGNNYSFILTNELELKQI